MTISGFESPVAAPIKQNEIKMLFCSKAFRARCFKGQGNARGNTLAETTVSAGKGKLTSTTLLSDQRGAVALEMPAVCFFVIIGLLLPLADVAIAGFKYISAQEALRGFGQSIQYSPPSDFTDTSSWASSALAKADSRFPIPAIQLICGDSKSACSSTNTASPKYYSYTTTVTLTPILALMKPLLCTSGNADPCSFTLFYSERFQ